MMYKKLSAILLAGVATLATAAAASAATPTGEFSVFAQCPTSNTSIDGCIYAKTESGEFVVGKKTVPITKAITLQGGFIENEATGAFTFVEAANGETLSKTPQSVPGGLAGLVNCKEVSEIVERILCEATFENSVTGVNATTELAAPASDIYLNEPNLLEEKGIALTLPVKVHLENPALGSECYVGSNSKPIELELTTGTTAPPAPNKAIKGSAGEISLNAEGSILTISKNELVNNSFAAPGVSGCGGDLSIIVDPVVDSELGVPAAAGHNTAILKGTLKQASAEEVRKH